MGFRLRASGNEHFAMNVTKIRKLILCVLGAIDFLEMKIIHFIILIVLIIFLFIIFIFSIACVRILFHLWLKK